MEDEEPLIIEDNVIIIDIIKRLHEVTECTEYQLEGYVERNLQQRLWNTESYGKVRGYQNIENIFKHEFRLAKEYEIIIHSKTFSSRTASVRLYSLNYENGIVKKILYKLKGLVEK